MKINDELLIGYLQGEVKADEAIRIEIWLSEDLSNLQRFNQFKVLWDASADLKFDQEIDVLASLERFRQKRLLQTASIGKGSPGKRYYLWIKIAAAILLLSSFSWLFFNHFSASQTTFLTQGMVKTATLSDGSVITLNKNSLLLYPQKFKGKLRQVWLSKGEAFFNIHHDRSKPFLIHTGKMVIKVVGTSFNVKNKRGLIEVIVETGMVLVIQNGQLLSLVPGERVLLGPDSRTMVKTSISDHLYNYYRSKKFVAEDTPLWRMVQVLNEAYSSHIVISRKELENLPLNTTFKDESLDDILQIICKTFNLKTEKKDNQVILY